MKQSGNNLMIQTKRRPTESGQFSQNNGKEEHMRKELSKIFSRAQTSIGQSRSTSRIRLSRGPLPPSTPYQGNNPAPTHNVGAVE